MHQNLKVLILAAMLSVAGVGGNLAMAQGEVYTLNPVVVTAQRIEKKDIDTPASTTIISNQDIKDKGYTTVGDALTQTIGVDAYSYTNGAEDLGGSQSRFYIRGMDKGTLVLVNGAPINIMNYSSTEGIPIDSVDKIEVIRGSNSVLYGAEAMGGVVNIITKHGSEPKTTVKAMYGNYNSGYQVGTQGENYTIFYDRHFYDDYTDSNKVYPGKTNYAWKNGKGQRDSFYTSVKLTDKLTLDWARVEANKNRYSMEQINGHRTGNINSSKVGKYEYDSVRNNLDLIYNDEESHFKSILAYNSRRLDTTNVYYNKNQERTKTSRGTNYNVYNFNFDNQKTWYFNDNKDSLTAGADLKYEHYKSLSDSDSRLGRKSYGLFASYSHAFNDRLTGIFGAREFVSQGNGWDEHQDEFLPQVQFLYKMSDKWSLYTNVGKSFDMPAVNSKFYSNKLKNWHVVPQSGWTYEFGSKYISGKDSLKLDVFHMNIDDYFEWIKEDKLITGGDGGINVQVNGGKFKNTGVEAEYTHEVNDNWKFNLGASISDPKIRDYGTNTWRQNAARVQLSAGIQYQKKKFFGALNYFLTTDREDSYYTKQGEIAKPNRTWDHAIEDRNILNAVFSYSPDKQQSVTLNMYNILDRHNPINNNENWDLPYNWTLTYSYSF